MATIKGARNNHKASRLERSLQQYLQTKGMVGTIEIKRFLNIHYVDILGREHDEYYFVPLIFGASRMPNAIGREIFDRWNTQMATENMIDFDTLTPEKVEAILVKNPIRIRAGHPPK